MKLKSYVAGKWVEGTGDGRPFIDPTTGEELGRVDATGVDGAAALEHARTVGGPALAALSFAERGAILRAIADALTANRDAYGEIARKNSGNTVRDAAIDIDGGIATLKVYARLGQSLGDAKVLVEPGEDVLARSGNFAARHFWTSRKGAALQINAFNFPSWGLWEKVAVALLAGSPSVAKPASATAWLSRQMVADVIAAGAVPEGALQIVCGGGKDLVAALQPMDSLAFTGSAATGEMLRSDPAVLRAAPRVTVEADSINATVLGPDAGPDSDVFALAVREVVSALSVKAGQLCTNIRRVLVPAEHADAFRDAVAAKLAGLTVGNPADESVRVGPLVDLDQRQTALEGIAALSAEATVVAGGGIPDQVVGADPQAGAFLAPTLLSCADPTDGRAVHEIEVFGPCATVMPYHGVDQAVALAAHGGGSLALSLFTGDRAVQRDVALGVAPFHGRVMMVDPEVGKDHTGHGIVMPQCVHGGPGRAGGGEELGGLRGLRLHMQRTAVQGAPAALAALADDATEATL
ncbi:3,4-dehydroadipyl-CoA semialdehyde dehydrogenase [Amorphus orientalis]|uniref:3,4-dehydroadipyl-CoA semialdehyde dehydrogenase n=1 Tax=Amorphus orientalis TaxID=649198 RepID=A0AAE4ATT9_9HYPH|nr:3,4-dehydroadipyl-CoA semialdehyde dehydrogenase [Amorphus orientalis]MDQ0316467.1 3,4-dehydroadipyl-CoA semialdehyde dehydrogenase [Amorphus orientalis]